MTIAREGWPYIAALAGAAAVLFAFRFQVMGFLLLALGLFTTFFFRDPEREVPGDARLVLSPADGKVVRIVPAPEDHPLGKGATQISIFLSVFDVHVNRSPIGGRIVSVQYHPGEFLPAFDDKASLRNEQNTVVVEGATSKVMFKQIAGLIARRIVFTKHKGDEVAAGERVGLIKFGSRVDVVLPEGLTLKVKTGDRVAGGVSVLAERP
jgi:phosphatidylserine decarboxylase